MYTVIFLYGHINIEWTIQWWTGEERPAIFSDKTIGPANFIARPITSQKVLEDDMSVISDGFFVDYSRVILKYLNLIFMRLKRKIKEKSKSRNKN